MALTSLALPSISQANTPTEKTSFSPRPYVEINVGPSFSSHENLSGDNVRDDGIGVNLNVGYQFFQYFGLEAGYTRLSTGDHQAFDAAMRFYLPFNEEDTLRLILKMGGAQYKDDNYTPASGRDKYHGSLYSAIGVSYSYTKNIDFIVMASAHDTLLPFVDGNYLLCTAGVTYNFW
ncbi:porin family protein [Thiotrichales bacterium 19S9-12]|nr:porin family protein [Thiotrichales bacterium 19S9-11]MCF6812260.1 porin family protein [Thiotrichales bacterium 19S9-12]